MGKIKFIKLDNWAQAADFVAEKLTGRLRQGVKVLWLVPGGSALDVAKMAASKINELGLGGNLTVSLTDERYGHAGHHDSNWRQLQEKGFFIKDARMLPVLHGETLEDTAASYYQMLNREIAAADYCLALAGMGEDGHIFGIKPSSPSITSKDDVVGYEWEDYTRLTPTGSFLKKIDEIILFVVGADKHRQLRLLDENLDPAVQPAQLLKRVSSVTILNDIKGEEI